ncbi:hypothetical protein BDC45DRAFT_531028 [Circinella umbellata]|nr:hypothetical protein BDC45DRAFT_531028 [Circinella umbellata]
MKQIIRDAHGMKKFYYFCFLISDGERRNHYTSTFSLKHTLLIVPMTINYLQVVVLVDVINLKYHRIMIISQLVIIKTVALRSMSSNDAILADITKNQDHQITTAVKTSVVAPTTMMITMSSLWHRLHIMI